MKIVIEESPYGDSGVTYDGMLGMMSHYVKQLESFRSQKKTKKQLEYLEADILGYRQIIESGSEENAIEFLRTKQAARNGFENNLKVIEFMKASGTWKETPE